MPKYDGEPSSFANAPANVSPNPKKAFSLFGYFELAYDVGFFASCCLRKRSSYLNPKQASLIESPNLSANQQNI